VGRSFWGGDSGQNTSFLSDFPSSKVVRLMSKMLIAWGFHWSVKHMQLWTQSLKREEWPSVKLLTFWESHLGHVIACCRTECTSDFCQICAFSFAWILGWKQKWSVPLTSYAPQLALCDCCRTPCNNKNLRMVFKGRIPDITMIQAKSMVTFANFQTVHFMKCFELWYNIGVC
jgi:hypothetical protein